MLSGILGCSSRLFLLVFVGSTLLFSQVPVSKSHDAAFKSRALSLDQRSAAYSDFVTNLPVGFVVRSCRSTILEIIVDCHRNDRLDNRTFVLTVYKRLREG
jgi:hypothetical protein